jgi:hypothetical protein
VNALKLVIAEFCVADTVVVLPATAEIGITVTSKLLVVVVEATTLLTSLTLNVTLAADCTVLGVPDTRPLPELRIIPIGNIPLLTK